MYKWSQFVVVAIVFTAMAMAGDTKVATDAKATWDGWISDVKCGAMVDPDCAKKCARAGIKPVFVNSDKTILQVANPDALKGHEGEHVTVKGKLDKGVLTVSSVSPFGAKQASK